MYYEITNVMTGDVIDIVWLDEATDSDLTSGEWSQVYRIDADEIALSPILREHEVDEPIYYLDDDGFDPLPETCGWSTIAELTAGSSLVLISDGAEESLYY